MTELSIVKLMLDKSNYNRYNNILDKIKVEKEIYKLLISISKYYEEYKDHIYLSIDELSNYFYMNYPSEKGNSLYEDMFLRLRSLEVSDSLASDIVRQHLERTAASECFDILLPLAEGDKAGLLLELPSIIDEFKRNANLVDEETSPFVDKDIETLAEFNLKVDGLQWRLEFLNKNIGPMSGGTLGHIFARPDAGKTSLIASEVAHFAGQLGDDECILVVGNEEDGRRLAWRYLQAMIGKPDSLLQAELAAHGPEYILEQARPLGWDKINFKYDPAVTYEEILGLVERMNARIIVVDIADHVGFRGSADLAGPARLGEVYRRYRSLAARTGADIITAGQANADVGGRKILQQEHMHNSKTDKPGALDYIVGIGKTFDPAEEDQRWLHIARSKISVVHESTGIVLFNKLNGRYEDDD